MNLPELALLPLFLKRQTYDEFSSELDLYSLKETSRELWRVYTTLAHYWESASPEETEVSLPGFEAYFYAHNPQSKKDEFNTLFERVREVSKDSFVVEDLLETLKKRIRATRIGRAALDYSTGQRPYDELVKAIEEFNKDAGPQSEVPSDFVDFNLGDILNETIHTGGLLWRLPSLYKRLGPLRPGDFGFVFARPETGKTTFLASEVSHFLDQLDKPILWLNNEEAGNKVALRIIQAYFGVNTTTLVQERSKYEAAFKKKVGDKIRLHDTGYLDRNKVEKLVREVDPGLIVIDQIDKVKGFEADRQDLMYGQIYQFFRQMAKGRCPIIGVCQASGEGENVKYLTMEHVAEARTSKQAEADWILGIGVTDRDRLTGMRHMSISKNKLTGDENTVASERHGRWETFIRPDRARYEDAGG